MLRKRKKRRWENIARWETSEKKAIKDIAPEATRLPLTRQNCIYNAAALAYGVYSFVRSFVRSFFQKREEGTRTLQLDTAHGFQLTSLEREREREKKRGIINLSEVDKRVE